MTWKQINRELKKQKRKLHKAEDLVRKQRDVIRDLNDLAGCDHRHESFYVVADMDQTLGCYECDRRKAHRL
jgi:hypothetical protein